MYICQSSIHTRKYFAIRVFPLLGTLYQIRYYKPLLLSSGRDVPAERLYKIVRVDQKGGIKPGFGITGFQPNLKNLKCILEYFFIILNMIYKISRSGSN